MLGGVYWFRFAGQVFWVELCSGFLNWVIFASFLSSICKEGFAGKCLLGQVWTSLYRTSEDRSRKERSSQDRSSQDC